MADIPTSPIIPAGAYAALGSGESRRRFDPFESQKQWGEALLAQTTKGGPKRSVLTGIADVGKAVIGGYSAYLAEQKQLERERNTAKAIGEVLADPEGGLKKYQA